MNRIFFFHFSLSQQDELDDEVSNQCAVSRLQHLDSELLMSESGKLVFLMELLDQLKRDGHRCLVFSQSRKMLDIIQKILLVRVCDTNNRYGHAVAALLYSWRLSRGSPFVQVISVCKLLALLCATAQQSYCHHVGVHRLSSVRP